MTRVQEKLASSRHARPGFRDEFRHHDRQGGHAGSNAMDQGGNGHRTANDQRSLASLPGASQAIRPLVSARMRRSLALAL